VVNVPFEIDPPPDPANVPIVVDPAATLRIRLLYMSAT
jgi:hypothetical protein